MELRFRSVKTDFKRRPFVSRMDLDLVSAMKDFRIIKENTALFYTRLLQLQLHQLCLSAPQILSDVFSAASTSTIIAETRNLSLN